MLASMGAFAAADTLVKISTATLSPAQVMFYLIGGAFIIFLLMAILQKDRLLDRRALSPILFLRYFSEVVGMVGMVMALTYVPISVVGAITQASPLLTALGAVLFLNEKMGWRRWCTFIIGFAGVLLIIQPGSVEFNLSVIWAIVAMLALAIRDLTTRLIPNDMPSASLATFTMAAALPCTALWVFYNGESFLPAQTNWLVIIPMIVLGAMGYLFIITSIRIAEVAVVMPFRYSRIIFLLILGIVVFEEKPNALMLIGAMLIIASGSYMMWREQQVKKQAQATLPSENPRAR